MLLNISSSFCKFHTYNNFILQKLQISPSVCRYNFSSYALSKYQFQQKLYYIECIYLSLTLYNSVYVIINVVYHYAFYYKEHQFTVIKWEHAMQCPLFPAFNIFCELQKDKFSCFNFMSAAKYIHFQYLAINCPHMGSQNNIYLYILQ